MAPQQNALTEWPGRIRRLLDHLELTQAQLAQRLGIAPSNISRWMRGTHEPTAEAYVALGNLARSPDDAFFFERAGFDTATNRKFAEFASSVSVNLKTLNLVAPKNVTRKLSGKTDAVAIPLLAVSAYADSVPPSQSVNLADVEMEKVLLAPLAWCKHPEKMISIHVQGDSMMPLIPSGSLLFVDTAVIDPRLVDHKLTLVSHRDLGFKVARFQRLKNADLLVSANHKYPPLDVSNGSKWKIFGEVLWWVSWDGAGTPGAQ